MTREIAWVKTIGFQVDQPLLDKLEAHREYLDTQRPEGAELTSMGATVRNLVLAGLEVAEKSRGTRGEGPWAKIGSGGRK